MIEYRNTAEGLVAEQLQGGFFDGWPHPPSAEKHVHLLNNSAHVWVAVDMSTNEVVGFITAISDGVMSAYIPLLEVLPAYKGRGIGQALTKRMLDTLQEFYMVDLLCDPNLQPFYQKLGMIPSTGMLIRNYNALKS
jgi:ribosomal protein S18 acetylase RimI-like enzyme